MVYFVRINRNFISNLYIMMNKLEFILVDKVRLIPIKCSILDVFIIMFSVWVQKQI